MAEVLKWHRDAADDVRAVYSPTHREVAEAIASADPSAELLAMCAKAIRQVLSRLEVVEKSSSPPQPHYYADLGNSVEWLRAALALLNGGGA